MSSILELIYGSEVRHFDAGQVVIDQGKKTDLLFFLVEVVKDGVQVATASQPGAVFGRIIRAARLQPHSDGPSA